MLQEVDYLNMNNSRLEEEVKDYSSVKEELRLKDTQNAVLLNLLGEKEEELELLYSDLKEVKNMYKEQLAEMLSKIAPSKNGDTLSDVHF